MALESHQPGTEFPALDLNELGFWAGYRAWLRHYRARLLVVSAILLALFVVALWVSATPQDPFSYDLY